MRRVVVVGSSGAGKTTLARELARRLGLKHVELDALYWKPNWTETATEEFRGKIDEALAGGQWTLCGNYTKVRDLTWGRADAIIWLDYPMSLVMWRVVRRTFVRCMRRESLWSTNVENWRLSFFDRESVIVWAWKTWRKHRQTFSRFFRSGEYSQARRYHFTSPRETEAWLKELAG